jgi:serine/threonine protein kinase
MDRIGRYKIVRELGRGAMGVVYHAIDPNIGRAVAIKTIQFGGNRKPEELERMRERLFREARSAGILSHPGIVTIYDVDQQAELAYIAMEYVDGPTLEQVLSESSPLPADRMFSILGQTAAALDYAHSKGIVHRDIKPANIMITADGTAKITDFGIAKITASEQLTMTGSIVGTPHYMSPEQVQGQAVDGRSDQFSLGVIAYELLTGEKPYTGEHLTTVVYKIVAEEPPPPRRLNPTLTPAIEAVIRKGLAKRPDGRYHGCQEFIDALDKACAASKGWKAMPRAGLLNEPTVAEARSSRFGPPPAPLPPPHRPRRDGTTTATVAEPRRKGGFVPFLLAILIAAGLLALIGWQAAPWLLPQRPGSRAQETAAAQAPAATPPAPQQSQPQSAPPQTAAPSEPVPSEPAPLPPAPAERPPSEEAKPSPMDTPASQRQPAREPIERRASLPAHPGPPQDVLVVTSPGGATARLDGDPSTACTTPCTLRATPGKHTVSVWAAGHQIESREIFVGTGPLEMPPITLRAAGGTLMLSSAPEGASISLNGRRLDQLTPANLTLAAGTYTLTIEKDGRQSTGTVEIKENITTYRRVVLNP